MTRQLRNAALLVATLVLAACSGTYRTHYDAPIDASVSRNWRVTDVTVTVPAELTVSEAKTLVPPADIVWREDPPGDRKAQIAVVMRDGIRRGTTRLRGSTPVRLQVEVVRFHALTFEAETRLRDAGVHNLHFYVTVVNARTGQTLAGPVRIEADVPAFSGAQAVQRRLAGETQRSVITNHLAATMAGWLGVGPDVRGTFARSGD